MFVVIIFARLNSVAIVPASWLKGMSVFWPKCRDSLREKLRRAGMPYKGPGKYFDVTTAGFAATYAEAEVLERATLSENAQLSADATILMSKRPKRTVKLPKKLLESGSYSEESTTSDESVQVIELSPPKLLCVSPNCNNEMQKPTPPPQMKTPHLNCAGIFESPPLLQSSLIHEAHNQPTCSYQQRMPLPSAAPLPSTIQQKSFSQSPSILENAAYFNPYNQAAPSTYPHPGFGVYSNVQQHSSLDALHTTMQTVLSEVRALNSRLDCMQNAILDLKKHQNQFVAQGSSEPTKSNNLWLELGLPLSTKQQFLDFEARLQDENARKSYMLAISGLSCSTGGQLIREILVHTIDSKLANDINISGQNGKTGMKGTKFLKTI